MKASKIQTLLTRILELGKEQETWIDSLPNEISGAFMDNGYTNSKSIQVDVLLDFIFDTWAEDVSYFLYEPSPHGITTDKGDYVITNVSEYVSYMVAEGFAEEDRI